MSVTLEKALEDVELIPGLTYACQVKGLTVEVHVLKDEPVAAGVESEFESTQRKAAPPAQFKDEKSLVKPATFKLSAMPIDDDLEDE